MNKRIQRHDAIRNIVRTHRIRTQRNLADLLREQGHECTQATVSRDISDIGLLKSGEGHYILPEDMRLRRMVAEFVDDVDVTGNLVVVGTFPGGASGVAGAIDQAAIPGILGTVAGDSCIMIATLSPEDGERVRETLKSLCRS